MNSEHPNCAQKPSGKKKPKAKPLPMISYEPALVKELGIMQAIVLAYCLFRIKKSKFSEGGKMWFFKTHEDLAIEIGSSSRTVARIIKELVEKDLLEVGRFSWGQLHNTNWYSPCYPQINLLREKLDLEPIEGLPNVYPKGYQNGKTGGTHLARLLTEQVPNQKKTITEEKSVVDNDFSSRSKLLQEQGISKGSANKLAKTHSKERIEIVLILLRAGWGRAGS